jgi:plastocyanin
MMHIRTVLAAASCAALLAQAPASAQSAPQQIDIALANYAFTPATLSLHAGTQYRLHLVNSSSKGHDFSAPEFFAASTMTPAEEAKVENGKVEVAKGGTVDVTLTPTHAGSYSLTCTHFMHTMLGMNGTITVQ